MGWRDSQSSSLQCRQKRGNPQSRQLGAQRFTANFVNYAGNRGSRAGVCAAPASVPTAPDAIDVLPGGSLSSRLSDWSAPALSSALERVEPVYFRQPRFPPPPPPLLLLTPDPAADLRHVFFSVKLVNYAPPPPIRRRRKHESNQLTRGERENIRYPTPYHFRDPEREVY